MSVVTAVNDDTPDDDSDASVPGLVPRCVPAAANLDHDSDSDDESMPCLVCRPHTDDDSSSDDDSDGPTSLHAASSVTMTAHPTTILQSTMMTSTMMTTSTTMILGLLHPTNMQTLHMTLHHLVKAPCMPLHPTTCLPLTTLSLELQIG
jgi:hypothetical protein